MGKDYYSKYHDEVMGADGGLGAGWRGERGREPVKIRIAYA